MTLNDWLITTKTPNAHFGARLGVSGETVRRWRANEREPDLATMAKIFDLTGGAVAPNDFAGVGTCA